MRLVVYGFGFLIGLIGLALWVAGVWYLGLLAKPDVPIPPMPMEVVPPESEPLPRPPSLDDLQVTVIRVGMDVTLLLEWERRQRAGPFHIYVEVDSSNVVLYSPGNPPRTIEVVPGAELLFYGSTLYYERIDNRLAIDLQVKNDD